VTADSQRLQQVQRSVQRLAVEVRALRERIGREPGEELRHALRRRGLRWKKVLHDGLILPETAAGRTQFYELLQHYSFRLFLRDVIKHRDHFELGDLVRYCSPQSARRYLQCLQHHGLVRRRGSSFRLTHGIASFGPTLEWFVAEVLRRDYGIPSAWNVRLDGAPGGGDYDVIGLQEGRCIYVETKSSPPRNIEVRQIGAFFDRLDTLRPDVALFLNDTQLRMEDKIALLFAAELRRRLGRHRRAWQVERLSGELFVIGDRLFIANSDPDLSGNIGTCLAHYFRGQGLHVSAPA
jgi:hypothetical protein